MTRAVTVCLLVVFAVMAWRTYRYFNALDTRVYYTAAVAIREGTPLYANAAVWREGGWIPGDPRPEWVDLPIDYPYAPPFAIAFVPLTLLPFTTVAALWFLALLAALLGTAWLLSGLLRSLLPHQRHLAAALLAALLMLFVPIRHDFFTGNSNILLLLFATLSLSDHVRGRNGRAGTWLALAATVKLTLLFPLLFFLLRGRYRSVATALGGVGGGLLLSTPVVGLEQLETFFTLGGYWTSDGYAVSPWGQSPNSLLLRAFTVNVIQQPIREWPGFVTAARVAGLLLGGTWLLLVLVSVRGGGAVSATLGFGATLLVMLLASPFTELPHFTFLVIVLVGLVVAVLRAPMPRWGKVVLLAGLCGGYAYFCVPALTLTGLDGRLLGRAVPYLPIWVRVNAAGIGLLLLSGWIGVTTAALWRSTRHGGPFDQAECAAVGTTRAVRLNGHRRHGDG